MTERVECTVKVVNRLGLHARAAAQLVKLAARAKCDVLLEYDGQEVNAKSIMGVLTLAAAQGSELRLVCEGEGARVASEQLKELFAAGFHEASK